MGKIRFRFRLWHLLLLIFLAGISLWVFTQYGTKVCEVEIEEFRIIGNIGEDNSNLQIRFRFVEPDELAHKRFDCITYRVPNDFLPNKLKAGQTIRFRYREKTLWIGVGESTWWHEEPEDPYQKFWARQFRISKEQVLTEDESKILEQVFLYNAPFYQPTE